MSHPEWIITSLELKECFSTVTLVDVRQPEEYEESHIPGSILIPLHELHQRAEKELLDKDADIVVYCAHGVRSLYGVGILRHLGFKKLRSLEGGIVDWEEVCGSTQFAG